MAEVTRRPLKVCTQCGRTEGVDGTKFSEQKNTCNSCRSKNNAKYDTNVSTLLDTWKERNKKTIAAYKKGNDPCPKCLVEYKNCKFCPVYQCKILYKAFDSPESVKILTAFQKNPSLCYERITSGMSPVEVN